MAAEAEAAATATELVTTPPSIRMPAATAAATVTELRVSAQPAAKVLAAVPPAPPTQEAAAALIAAAAEAAAADLRMSALPAAQALAAVPPAPPTKEAEAALVTAAAEAAAAAAAAAVFAHLQGREGRSGPHSPRGHCSPRSGFSSRSASPTTAGAAVLLTAAGTPRSAPQPVPCDPMLAYLAQEVAELRAQLALSHLPRTHEPPATAAYKPFKDHLPGLPPYSGAAPPEPFLARFRTLARHLLVPAELLPRQLIAKLTGEALEWFNLHFAGQDDTASVEQIALGLRTAFGREFAGAQAYLDTCQVQPNLELGGSQRLLALDQIEERARQYRVPFHPGPKEARFCKLLALFSPSERNQFLAELTANPHCSEAALRQLEESAPSAGDKDGLGPARASLLEPPSLAREALFALRVELAEAALHRIQPRRPSGQQARPAHVLLTSGTPSGSPPPPLPATPAPIPPPPQTAPSAVGADMAECRILTERLTELGGRGFKGPPHYFGDNLDPDRRKRNAAEFVRRRDRGLCFKCTPDELGAHDCPFLQCPRHGVEATRSGVAATAPSVRRQRA